ncbi:MAG: HEAT repeat domain-containing protein [Anaerolineae bacterium]|nr:HEAT repeat domain-containing protein [Anaerolineae bacterium]
MPDTLFISYKSEENPFALQLAAALKNHGVNIWIDRMDIRPGDNWDEAIDEALKRHCRGMIVILTPDYLKSRVCHDEWSYALEKDWPIFPILLRRLNDDDIPFRLRRIQRLNFLDWLDDKAYQAQFELLVERIQRDQNDSFGDVPSAEIQYLTSLIADLESQQGVENHIALSAQSEVVRVDPRPRKNVEPSLALLLKSPTPERELRPETKKIENIQQAVADHDKFVLIGDPGAGKTTTIRRLALEMARARLEGLKMGDSSFALPFLVYLPRWSDESTAVDFIRRRWEATYMSGDVVRKLQSGQVRLYLDGLNEMGGEGKNKAALLRQWLQSPDGPRYAVLTCRQGDYHGDLKLGDLPTVLVEPLTDEKIREFAVQHLGEEQAKTFLEKVFPQYERYDSDGDRKRKDERSLLHLARNPYLLAALALIFEYGGDLPRNTGALFHQLVTVLWERERLRQTPSWIPLEQMQAGFGNLAFSMIDEDQPIDVLVDYAEGKLGNTDLLNVGRSANLITMNGDEMRFSHQLMLEYFAAVGLSRVEFETKLRKPSFGYFGRTVGKWDEAVIALCGLLADSSSVIIQITGIDPLLAADCLASGIEVSDSARAKVIDTLSAALNNNNATMRGSVTLALGQIGDPAAVPPLLDILRDADEIVRGRAWEALGNIGTPAVPRLLESLRDFNEKVRAGAANALGNIKDPVALPNLLEALHDPSPQVRASAAAALGNIGDPIAITALSDALRDSDISVRRLAANALGNIGDPVALPNLLEALHDPSPQVRASAVAALGNIGDVTAVSSLLEALHDKDSDVRSHTTQALGSIGDVASISSLLETLGDTDWLVRRNAVEALEKIGTPAIPGLLDTLRDLKKYGRAAAALALGRIGDLTATPVLLDTLHDREAVVRKNVVEALGQIGDPTTTPALLSTLSDSDPYVRSETAKTLGILGNPSAVPSLIEALSDTERLLGTGKEFVCDHAAEALEKIGTSEGLEVVHRWWDNPVPFYLKGLLAENAAIREGAAYRLGEIGDSTAVPGLAEALRDSDDRVRYKAIEALTRIGTPAIAGLLHALHDCDDLWVLGRAVVVLKNIGELAIPELLVALHDSEANVRRIAVVVLGNIGDSAVIPILLDTLRDSDADVRSDAVWALGQIGTPEALEAVRRWREEQGNSDKSK